MSSAVFTHSPPPPPDPTVPPVLDGDELVAVFYAGGPHRTVVSRDVKGFFRVLVETWQASGHGGDSVLAATWIPGAMAL